MTTKLTTAQTLKLWLDKHEAILIDVREPTEHDAQRIPGARLLPLGTVSAAALPAECANKKLVVHCGGGGRANTACQKLLAENPALELYNLEGGIRAWVAAGLPVISGERSVLPLERQVQLTLGILLLAASLLAYALSPAFLLLTGAIGAGLTFAGATGFCGLAHCIARMPWNRQKPAFCLSRKA